MQKGMVFMAKSHSTYDVYDRYGKKPEGTPTDRWAYKSITDPQYIKDRNKLFKENGNGWWWYQGFHVWKHSAIKK